ncbi:T-cell surface glycoprotein CD1a [Hippopotamus amphibius kiboko]|uniref:T-cell surface glycoprotein CD1a n=1 Tax=Hippopotamus amphibius kiboko TaxID=575201 RepID=UPI002594943C|nr:T-cell surface glycoprotein CD1a [Hippopotamus amphibius kiboko]
MLFLQLPLLLALLPGGNSVDGFQEPISFQIMWSFLFYNRSWVQNAGSGWLGELQTHGWDSSSDTIIYRWPWSKGNLSNEQLMELQNFFRMNLIAFVQGHHDHASQWQLEYPFEVQVAGGCELHVGEASVGFIQVAYQGSESLSFQNNSWVPAPEGGRRAQQVSSLLNYYEVAREETCNMLSDTCPCFLLGLLDAGKADLQRQVRPEAWLSPGPDPGPGRLMLGCHVSGFYPKPIWVVWMRGEQEQQGAQRSDVLPNADGTWYLRSSLDVEASEASGLSCRVRHSSLGGQDIILYWDPQSSVGWIVLAVIVPLVLLIALAFWLRKRWTHCELLSGLIPLE